MFEDTGNQPAARSGSTVNTTVIFGAIALIMLGNLYTYSQVNELRAEVSKMRESTTGELTRFKESSTTTLEASRREITRMENQLDTTRRQASMAAGQAKIDAMRRAEELAAKLQVEQNRTQEAQKRISQEMVVAKEAVVSANNRIGEVSTEVSAVKTDVANTKSDLEKTTSNLSRAMGEQGVMSGLIATNSSELRALKELGDRNYYEFNISKTKEPQRIGDVMVKLKKADTKRNRYTIELTADDKRVEKKDRSINEPVQFYVLRSRQPYELVVNEVRKDQLVGYLSTPKVQTTRN